MPDFISELLREDRQLVRRVLARLAQGPTFLRVDGRYVNTAYIVEVWNVDDAEMGKGMAIRLVNRDLELTVDPAEIAALRAWCEKED